MTVNQKESSKFGKDVEKLEHLCIAGHNCKIVQAVWKIVLTIWTFVGKVMSLLFNTLSATAAVMSVVSDSV